MIQIGFTGTRSGMTPQQATTLHAMLAEVPRGWFHHGDCIGADARAHRIVRDHRWMVMVHPPTNPRLRAFCVGDMETPPREYLRRNADIVEASSVLIACPDGPEKVHSGTWATVRLAVKQYTRVYLIMPDGVRLTR